MRTLTRGDTGTDVRAVVEALVSLGHLSRSGDKVTAAVEKAVRAFQLEAGLIVDGLAGRRTINALHLRAGRQVQQLVIHHAATPRSTTVEEIRAYHMQVRGWRDVAYHTCLRQVEGSKLVEVAPGRSHDGDGFLAAPETGAGVVGSVNFWSLQVCLVGDFDEEPVPPEMWDVLIFWLSAQCRALGLGSGDIVGHREVSDQGGTVCPGRYVDLDKARTEVASLLLALGEAA